VSRLERALALYNKARGLRDAGSHAKAAAQFAAIVDRYGDDPPQGRVDIPLDAQLGLARALDALGRVDEAVAAYDALIARWGDERAPASRASLAFGLVSKGYMLLEDGRFDEGLAAYEEAATRFGTDRKRRVARQVAFALSGKAYAVAEVTGREEEAVEAFAALLAHAARRKPPRTERKARRRRDEAAAARVSQGSLLLRLGRPEQALAAYDAVIAADGADDQPAAARPLANAWYGRAFALGELGRWEEAMAACDDALARLEGVGGRGVARSVASILYKKGYLMGTLGRRGEAIAAWDALMARFGDAEEPALRRYVRRALDAKVDALALDDRHDEVVEACDALIAGEEDDASGEALADVASAHRRRARALDGLGETAAAVAAYRETLVRFGAFEEPEVQRELLVTKAWLAAALLELGDAPEALVMLDAYLAQAAESPGPVDLHAISWAQLRRGTTLQQIGRLEEAVLVYDEVVDALDGVEDPTLRPRLVVALMNKVETLEMAGREDEAFAENDRLVAVLEPDAGAVFAALRAELGDRQDPQARVERAGLALKEASVVAALGREAEAVALLAALVERFDGDELPDVRRMVGLARDGLDEMGDPDVL
jgi:tetratricopeptide (TPR) repeat protein